MIQNWVIVNNETNVILSEGWETHEEALEELEGMVLLGASGKHLRIRLKSIKMKECKK